MTKVKQKKFEESKMRSKEENINLSNIKYININIGFS